MQPRRYVSEGINVNFKQIVSLFLLFYCIHANAGWINKQGQILPDEEHRKSIGDFGAELIFVDNEQKLFQRWAIPSETVNLNTIESISINKPISAFIIFSGCKSDTTGNCSVAMRFKVLQPDGKLYAKTQAMEVWHNKPAPLNHTLGLSIEYLKIVVESHEQLGNYIVVAQVRDNISGDVISLQKTFSVSSYLTTEND